MEGSEDIFFFQEHSVAADWAGLVTALTAEKGRRRDIGPINISTERSSAGEGVMWRLGNIKVQVVKLAAQHAKDMESIGRLRKYVIQYALGYPFTVHNIHA